MKITNARAAEFKRRIVAPDGRLYCLGSHHVADLLADREETHLALRNLTYLVELSIAAPSWDALAPDFDAQLNAAVAQCRALLTASESP